MATGSLRCSVHVRKLRDRFAQSAGNARRACRSQAPLPFRSRPGDRFGCGRLRPVRAGLESHAALKHISSGQGASGKGGIAGGGARDWRSGIRWGGGQGTSASAARNATVTAQCAAYTSSVHGAEVKNNAGRNGKKNSSSHTRCGEKSRVPAIRRPLSGGGRPEHPQ